jgi:hypothetical protein
LCGESRGNRSSQAIPTFCLLPQTPSTGGGQLIKLGAPIVFRRSPACLEQSLPHQAEQGGVKRALFDQQRSSRNLLDAQQNSVAVQRTKRDCLQNEEVKSAGKKLGLGGQCPS